MCHKVAHPFYGTAKWKQVRKQYLATVHYICEECGRPAEQVHHKDELKEEDYFVNYEKCYGFDNLIALCRHCHNRKPGHFLAHLNKQAVADGYKVDMVTGEISSADNTNVSPPYPQGHFSASKPLALGYEKLQEER